MASLSCTLLGWPPCRSLYARCIDLDQYNEPACAKTKEAADAANIHTDWYGPRGKVEGSEWERKNVRRWIHRRVVRPKRWFNVTRLSSSEKVKRHKSDMKPRLESKEGETPQDGWHGKIPTLSGISCLPLPVLVLESTAVE